jgi:hypothetical protein
MCRHIGRIALPVAFAWVVVPGAQTAQPQAVEPVISVLTSHEYNLETTGVAFLLDEARKGDYFLLGELHGDNEIPQLIHRIWPEMWKNGYRHVAAEVSPWAADQLQTASASDKPHFEGLWTKKQADDVNSPAGKGNGVLWGCDMEEMHPEYLIRELAALNPADASLKKMVEITKDGYQRSMAENLLSLLEASKADRDVHVNDISLRQNLLATLEIDAHRANSATRMAAQNRREILLKTQILEHLQNNPSGRSKVLLRFGRNHLHRGYDARGISTLGNFMAEFALSRGQSVFNVGAFGAGGQATLMGETFSADERGDEPAFALLSEKSHYAATVFDLRPLRPLLHAIPTEKRSPLEVNLTYWADAYDALICYKTVTPLKE